MPTHVALLRGINVGGRNRITMADLRAIVSGLGHTDVATYVASGNVVFTAAAGAADTLATDLQHAIGDALDIEPAVIVLPRGQFDQIVADNPFPAPDDLRHVHVIFRTDEPTVGTLEATTEAQRRAAEDGVRDEAVFVGRTLYLHTPDGFGRSRLAELLNRSSVLADATARNLRTVTRLQAMLDA